MARDQRKEGEGIRTSSSASSTTAIQEYSKQNIRENQDICCYGKKHRNSYKQQHQEPNKWACSEQARVQDNNLEMLW